MNKYANTIEVIVRLVIKRENKVLLCVNKETNSYFLAGGHVEFGDTFEKTIYKETAEELGWTKEDIRSFKFKGYLENSYSYKDGAEPHAEVNMIFDVQINDSASIESKESHIGFEWVEVSNVQNIKILPEPIVPFLTQ
ncbi:MAG: NUDIX domain-containing protein [Patescibacteria group bacterium]